MIIDSHAHYSQPHSAERPYDPELIRTNPELTRTRFLSVEDLLAAAKDAGVDQVVQVTNTKMGYDNRYSLEGAERYPDRIFGVMGRFDPFAPDVEGCLRSYMAHPKMLAVRFTLLTAQNEPWLRQGTLDAFLAVAQKLEVPVQLFAPGQFPEMRATARRFPGARFIIDHMGLHNGPPPEPLEQVFRRWDEAITLAGEPNVWTKFSFFPEAAYASERFPFVAAQEKFRRMYERVGADRLIWGANYPPVQNVGAATYREAVDFLRVHCPFVSAGDRAAMFAGNLARCCARQAGGRRTP